MGSPALWIFLFSVLISPWIARYDTWGRESTHSPSSLSERERDSLRYHLENFYNEVDLLIRNQRVDSFDLQRQEKDLVTLKVFERIPFNQEVIEMKEALAKDAKASGLLMTHFKIVPIASLTPSLPPFIYTNSTFHFRDEQLVKRIKFVMSVRGQNVQKWIDSLPYNIVRYIKVDRTQQTGKSWQISASAFRFRNIRFPPIRPKDPLTYLPIWAQKNPVKFAQTEPVLWSFIKRIEALTPKTQHLYEERGRFLLNDARLSFFIRLTQHL